ncbi:MAG: methionine--tRNA ligase [Actinomycetota bacterium]|nr:methionine--tRNA ligase [Actinomycetota bacterium]
MCNREKPKNPWYITTAIPYVNARPHIGFALEILLADALARYHRLKGYDVRFLTGTDDNSLKNVQAARELGVSTAELVERNSRAFEALRETLALSFDDFIRTSADVRHIAGVEKLWRACAASGDVYKKAYAGLYCVGCEQFYAEQELEDGRCPEHGTRPELVEEDNYFFRLSKYQERLEGLVDSDELRIVPQSRKNEVLSFIRSGLADFSISRSRGRSEGWGIGVPDDPGQVMYVWFDALANYVTALDYAEEGALYTQFWVNNPRRTHVIGKGIVRFHAVYWPAMLLSAQIPPPSTILVHGYLTVEGRKISKSFGNAIDPADWAARFGTDALRYYLLGHVRADDDADVSLRSFVDAYNAHLANQLGNLVNRLATMLDRYCEGVVPPALSRDEEARPLETIARKLPRRLDDAAALFSTSGGLAAIWELIGEANRYVVRVRPWELARAPDANAQARLRLETALYNLAETLRLVAYFLAPFLPQAAAVIECRFEPRDEDRREAASRWGALRPGTRFRLGPALFPRIDLSSSGQQGN